MTLRLFDMSQQNLGLFEFGNSNIFFNKMFNGILKFIFILLLEQQKKYRFSSILKQVRQKNKRQHLKMKKITFICN